MINISRQIEIHIITGAKIGYNQGVPSIDFACYNNQARQQRENTTTQTKQRGAYAVSIKCCVISRWDRQQRIHIQL